MNSKHDHPRSVGPGGFHFDGSAYSFTIRENFEHPQRARLLAFIGPLALGLILGLMYLSTPFVADALVILTGAPFATLGGIVALWRSVAGHGYGHQEFQAFPDC